MKSKRWSRTRIGLSLLVALTTSSAGHVSAADSKISVVLNGNPLSFDVPPQVVHDRTLVPFRQLLESLGADVTWDSNTHVAIAKKGNHVFRVPVSSYTIFKDDNPIPMDTPVTLAQGRVLVPLRYISEALDANVTWQEDINTVFIHISSQPYPHRDTETASLPADIQVGSLDSRVPQETLQHIQQLIQQEDMTGRIERELGIRFSKPVHLYVALDDQAYRDTMNQLQYPQEEIEAIVQNSNGVASGNDIVIVLSRNNSDSLLKNVVQHELTHVALNQYGASDGMPSWVNEGIAWRLGLLAEIEGESDFMANRYRKELRYSLLDALSKKQWIPLIHDPMDTITEKVPYNVEVQDYFAVDYLIQQFGQASVQNYLRALKDGNRDPFSLAFGEPEPAFENQFTSYMNQLLNRPDQGVQITFRVEPDFSGYVALMGKGKTEWTRYHLPAGTYSAILYPDGRIKGLSGGETVPAPGTPEANTVFIGMKPFLPMLSGGKWVQSGGFAVQSGYGEYFLLNAWRSYTDGTTDYPISPQNMGVTLLQVEPLSYTDKAE